MIQTIFRSPEVTRAMQAPPPPGTPPLATFMFTYFQLFFLAFLLVSALMLVSSIGLLKRWNWARICFVGLMGLGILWQLVGLGIQYSMLSPMQEQFASATTHGGPNMQPFLIAMTVASVLFAVGLGVLFGWIAKKLLSAPIAAEFRR